MDHDEWLAERFQEQRTQLRAVAYRMLGSLNEADDAVQEARLRLSRSDISGVENLGGWLRTVVVRVALNMLIYRGPTQRIAHGRCERDGRAADICEVVRAGACRATERSPKVRAHTREGDLLSGGLSSRPRQDRRLAR